MSGPVPRPDAHDRPAPATSDPERAAAEISALVSSRICHDLVSPIGAIANGIELLTFGATAPSPELGLIAESVKSASERLGYFRLAFGAAAEGATVPMAELRTAVMALDGPRTSVRMTADGTAVDRRRAKLLTLLLLCQERALPFGGAIEIALEPEIVVRATSERLRDLGPLWSMVDAPGAAAPCAPAEVQFLLLGVELRATGARLRRDARADAVELRIEMAG